MKKFLKRKAPNSATNARNSHTEDINQEEKIQFDLGKRKMVDDYHPNQKDVVKRKYLDNGPCQPHTSDFPYILFGDKNRWFNPEWFDKLA